MRYTIREATENDYPQIQKLINEFTRFQKAPEKVIITVGKMVEQKDYFNCLVAADNQRKTIGYTNYSIIYYSWLGKSTYLDDLHEMRAHQGKGIGSNLLYKVFNIARKEKCNRVRWQVSKWNTKAIEFYKKIGAQIDDIEINCEHLVNEK